MKKFLKFLILSFLLFTIVTEAQNYKKYAPKSGYMEYTLSGNATGTSKIYWDDWGRKELHVDDTKTTVFGMTNEEHKRTLMLGTDVYTWKENSKQIQKSENPVARVWKDNNYDENDIDTFSKKTLESSGFKKNGEETINGRACDVYEGVAGKVWISQKEKIGVKSNIKILGIDVISEATKIELNKSISSSLFEIPKGMEIVTVEQANSGQANNQEDIKNQIKNIFKSNSSNKGTVSKTETKDTTKKSDKSFTDELIDSGKEAAVEGAKEGAKETVKETAKDEAKKATKKTIKKLFKSIF